MGDSMSKICRSFAATRRKVLKSLAQCVMMGLAQSVIPAYILRGLSGGPMNMNRGFGRRVGNGGASGMGLRLPIRLHLRQDLHLARKLWHMLMGLLMVAVFLSGLSRASATLILGTMLGITLLLETARLRNPALNEAVVRFWGPIIRSCEVNRLSGTPYYLGSALIAVALFPKPIAALSLLFLACGDPMASLFGILYGKHGPRFSSGKSAIGTAAGVLTCALVSLLFWNSFPFIQGSDFFLLVVLGGLAGGLAELAPWDVDDNFSIPIVSGLTLWMACLILGLPV
jgi:diacylglycerol kinase (CTP)